MLTTIKGVYDDGKIVLTEEPPVTTKTDVMVTFLTEDKTPNSKQRRKPGGLKGKVTIPDDFNEPLDDLKDYM
jgi:Protein of unknown function (DUF2281)